MKALMIAPEPFFTPRGTPLSVYYRCLVATELGTEIDLLTYGEGDDVALDGLNIIRVPRFSFLGSVKIGPSFHKFLLDALIVVWAVGLLVTRRYDFVHAHEESVFICRFLKPLFRFKLVYDMHSSLPEQLVNYKFTQSKALIGLFRALEDSSLSAADAVITICPELASYAVTRMPDEKRHFLIENSIFDDVRLGNGADVEAKAAPLAPLPDNRPIVAYIGTFEAYQGIDILIEGFAQARESRPDAFLLLVGGAPAQVEDAKALAHRSGLEGHVLFTGRVPKSAARAYLAKADVVTSPRTDGINTPLKIYEQLASGTPLVATRILSHTQVLTDEVSFLVEPTAEGMAGGILAALAEDGRRDEVVETARALYDAHYSRGVYRAEMERLLELVR